MNESAETIQVKSRTGSWGNSRAILKHISMLFRGSDQKERSVFQYGSVAEWFKAAVLKTVVSQGTVSSNPTTSASYGNMAERLKAAVC